MAEGGMAEAGKEVSSGTSTVTTPPTVEEVEIRAIGAGGVGVASLPDGKTIFVPRSAPGDRLLVRVEEEKARWARGSPVEVLTPGSGRREARCPLYEECGGCTLQHLAYDHQCAWKARILVDALHRIGGVKREPPPLTPSPQEYHYRNRITFTLRRSGVAGVRAGFHERDNPDRLVEVTDSCLLAEPGIVEVWTMLREAWGRGASLLPGGGRLRLTLRRSTEGVDLIVHGGRGEGNPQAILERVDGLRSIWKRSRKRGETRLLGVADPAGAGSEGSPPGDAPPFVQVNRRAAEMLATRVMELVLPVSGSRVVDGYAGIGIYGHRLARQGARVTAIESDLEAVRVARAQEQEDWAVLPGRVEERLEEALPADLVILNPPRAGLHRNVPSILEKTPPARLVYVSCDPATFARDVRRLQGSHRLDHLEAFDLFPQTAHVECVGIFTHESH